MFDRFKMIGESLFTLGMNDPKSGNISVREEDKIHITKRNCWLSCLKEYDLIALPVEAEASQDSEASVDLPVHRAVYQLTAHKAVIHAHSPYLCALSITENKIMLPETKGSMIFQNGVPITRLRQGISSEEAARTIVSNFTSGYRAVAIKGHGFFVAASNLEEAYEWSVCLENSAKIIALTKMIPDRAAAVVPQHQQSRPYEHRKRSAIPPSIGVMDRRTTTASYGRGPKR
jgi:L-fuculose-phosphate aldolase